MSFSEKRTLIELDSKEFSIVKQCDILQINRSSLYYRPMGASDYNLQLMRAMDELHLKDPTLGTRRMTKYLVKKGYKISRNKTRRLMRLMRISAVYCVPRTTVSDPTRYKYPYLLKGLEITRPNQVWMIDISYIPMAKGFMYFFGILDVYSRKLLGWSLSNSMEASWVCSCISDTISRFGKPEIINSDQGSQFTSEQYIALIKSYQTIHISMDGKGRAIDNVFIERFFRTLKYDKLYLCPAGDGLELYTHCKEFITYYNQERMHSSIEDYTPDQYYHKVA